MEGKVAQGKPARIRQREQQGRRPRLRQHRRRRQGDVVVGHVVGLGQERRWRQNVHLNSSSTYNTNMKNE